MNLFNFLSDNIIGLAEDNAWMMVVGHQFKLNNSLFFPNIGYPYGYVFESNFNQPLSQIPYALLSFYFNEIFSYNIINILTFIVNLLVIYFIFSKFTKRPYAVLGSIIFSFSPFFLYQSRSHLDLMQFWILAIYIYKLVTTRNYNGFFCLGALLIVVTAFSNYFGLFGGLFTAIYFLLQIINSFLNKGENLKPLLIKIINLSLGLLIALCVFILSYNYAVKDFNGIKAIAYESSMQAKSFDDFIYFSSRPWYFLLPSPENPIFGKITLSIIGFLQNDWKYWLTLNYFPAEHTASFLGITNIVLAILGWHYIYKNKKFRNRSMYLYLLITQVSLMLLMLPPYITISSYKIYTPGYLLATIFPFFRTTARLGILVLFIHMLFVLKGYEYIGSRLSRYSWVSLVILFIFAIQITEFFVPFRITNASKPPDVFRYLKENTRSNQPFAVYPYVMAHETFFWMRYYNRPFVNPRISKPLHSENFTDNLPSCLGLSSLIKLNAEYLVVYSIANPEAKGFFDKNLNKIADFGEDIHNRQDFAGTLYKIDNNNCIDIEAYSNYN